MSAKKLTARTAEVGGIPIARLLPNRGKQPIGAWCFLDHIGPAEIEAGEPGMQVGRHPHTNLQTFTWMLHGEIRHRDSLGYDQIIRKGQVNLMTAGTGPETGISHTEQSVVDEDNRFHAVQLWIALPMDKQIQPSFHHYPDLPTWQSQGIRYALTTGSYTDGETYTAPTLQYSKLVGLDVIFDEDGTAHLSFEAGMEYGILIINGEVTHEGETFVQDELMRFETSQVAQRVQITAKAGTHVMLLGGEPLPHKTLLWWNFVDKSKAGIEKSIEDWNNGHERFGDVAGGMHRLPSPPLPESFKE